MKDNGLINKESVEALIALTDLIKKSDEKGDVIEYDVETSERIYNITKNTEGINENLVDILKYESQKQREKNQGMVVDFAAYSDDELYFLLSPKVCTEVYEILKNIEKEQVLKIPRKYLDVIINNRDTENPAIYDWDIPLVNQDFESGTMKFLNWVCYNFWLENDEEREVWKHRFDHTELAIQDKSWFQKIIEKYCK